MDISGAPQTRPIANSAPNPLGPYCQNLGELYQRQYTCTYLSVAEGVLKIYRPSSVKFKGVIVFCYPIFYN